MTATAGPARRRRYWRPVLPLALAVGILAWLHGATPVAADLGGFEIAAFHTDLTVLENAELEVSERIAVQFSQRRHGLYRRIPVRYTDPRGFTYAIRFRLLSVSNPETGDTWPTQLSSEGPYVRIRIGDPDRTVTGRQVYLIRYRVGGAVRHVDEHDELYWNAVGDEWQTSIGQATATVHLPAGIRKEDLKADAFVGRFGSTEKGVGIALGDSRLDYRAPRPLGPREGLTVVAAWPPGAVRFPSAATRGLSRLLDNWIILSPLAALAFWYDRYRKLGRDPVGRASIAVQYEPPPGVSPSEVGTLVDEKVDLRDITAAIVDLAIKGRLRIHVEKQERALLPDRETIIFEQLSAPDAELLPHERTILAALFSGRDRVAVDDLREEFYRDLPAIRQAICSRLVAEGHLAGNPETTRQAYAVGALLSGIAVALVGVGWAYLRGGILPQAGIVPAVAGVLVGLIGLAFAPAMPRRTASGVALRQWALGFQEFVDRVESDRLTREAARQVFERLLPYAMALGVAARWAKKFEGIYETAPPSWYVLPGVSGRGFQTSTMEQSLSRSMAGAAAAMAVTPRSSGSSGFGGGFSGGGFGGGGGGSW